MMNELRIAAHQVRFSAFSRFKAAIKSSDLDRNGFAIDAESAQRLKPIKDLYNCWIEPIANTISDTVAGLSPVRVVRLFENESGELSFQGDAQSTDFSVADKCDLFRTGPELALAFTRSGIHDPDLPLRQACQPASVL